MNIKNAIAMIQSAIKTKQAAIDAEQDPIKKSELVAEMHHFVQELGLVFDGDKVAAEQVVIDMAEADKPSLFARVKNWFAGKVEVVKENKVKTAAAVAAVAAAVAGAVYVSRNPAAVETVQGLFKKSTDTTGEAPAEAGILSKAGDLLARVANAVVGGIVAAKDWVVGLFRKPATVDTNTPATVTGDIDINLGAPVAV